MTNIRQCIHFSCSPYAMSNNSVFECTKSPADLISGERVSAVGSPMLKSFADNASLFLDTVIWQNADLYSYNKQWQKNEMQW